MNKVENEDERAVPVSITIKRAVLKRIDTERGLVSRSAWIVEKYLPKGNQDVVAEDVRVKADMPDNKKRDTG